MLIERRSLQFLLYIHAVRYRKIDVHEIVPIHDQANNCSSRHRPGEIGRRPYIEYKISNKYRVYLYVGWLIRIRNDT